jgi:membrane-associated phospholipid phosphatase
MLRFEWVAAGYFVALAVGATVASVSLHRALRGAAASCAAAAFVVIASRMLPGDARSWLGHLYLVLGYWIPSMLTKSAGETRFEAWLRRCDTAWRSHVRPLSPRMGGILEIAYLACFVVVPLAFLIVWIYGTVEDVDRFWVAVLVSGFACYITLPWLVSRPPRMFDDVSTRPPGPASFNVSLLRRVSHELNTFPSGHVAVATAVAVTVFPVSALAGTVFGLVAAGIAAGAAAGRYHYGIDVVVGAIAGAVAAIAAFSI